MPETLPNVDFELQIFFKMHLLNFGLQYCVFLKTLKRIVQLGLALRTDIFRLLSGYPPGKL